MGKEETVIGIKASFSEYILFYTFDFGTMQIFATKQIKQLL